jgi:hypothetical protein
MKICKSDKFIFVVFEKKCLCNIFVLNAKSTIVSRTISIAFFFIKAEILNISLDLWFRFFAQTIKRQNLDDELMKNLNVWRNSIFFSRAIIFFFSFVALKYFCHDCSVRIVDQTFRLRRAVDTTSTHFWFQCDFDFDTSFVHDTVASIALWMLDWMRFTKTFICSTIFNDDDTMNKRKLLRSFSTSTRFHALFCLIDTESISNVNVMKIDMWFDD